MNKLITADLVREFWQHMRVRFGFRVVQKAGAEEMDAIGWALEMLGVQTKETFMSQYTTTIGKVVYTPFVVGDDAGGVSLEDQLITCVHEAEHVVQYGRNRLEFLRNYLVSPSARAHYESEAYLTNMEMHFYLTGEMLDPLTLARKMHAYGIDATSIDVARKQLSIAAKIVCHGDVVSNTSMAAISWLKKRGIQKAKNC